MEIKKKALNISFFLDQKIEQKYNSGTIQSEAIGQLMFQQKVLCSLTCRLFSNPEKNVRLAIQIDINKMNN